MFLYELEEIKPAETVEEMRAEIYRLQNYDPLVRSVLHQSLHKGRNTEDTYTVLAYEALKARRAVSKSYFDLVALTPALRIIIPNTPE